MAAIKRAAKEPKAEKATTAKPKATKAKYIGYVITCGGDAGWRFSNGPEWHSMQGRILFPFENWDKKSIKTFLDGLDKELFKCHCSTLGELLDKGQEILAPAFKKEGICSQSDYTYEEDGWKREGSFVSLGAKSLSSKKVEIIDYKELK